MQDTPDSKERVRIIHHLPSGEREDQRTEILQLSSKQTTVPASLRSTGASLQPLLLRPSRQLPCGSPVSPGLPPSSLHSVAKHKLRPCSSSRQILPAPSVVASEALSGQGPVRVPAISPCPRPSLCYCPWPSPCPSAPLCL